MGLRYYIYPLLETNGTTEPRSMEPADRKNSGLGIERGYDRPKHVNEKPGWMHVGLEQIGMASSFILQRGYSNALE